jgi:hypothetical protein
MVIAKVQPETGCDLCPFPTRHMAKIRIINPFGAPQFTDFNACWACFERWVEDSDHIPLTSRPEERPVQAMPIYQNRTPFMISGNYWHRTEGEER